MWQMFLLPMISLAGCAAGAGLSAAWLGFSVVRPESRQDSTHVDRERRCDARPRVRFDASLDVEQEGVTLAARGLNLHEAGGLVLARRPVTINSAVYFRDRTHRSMGFAIVRHCTPGGRGLYRIGLEFCGQLMRSDPGTWHIRRMTAD
jgi:hypothetical protein